MEDLTSKTNKSFLDGDKAPSDKQIVYKMIQSLDQSIQELLLDSDRQQYYEKTRKHHLQSSFDLQVITSFAK